MYLMAHSLPEIFGRDVTANRQEEAPGVEYNNSSSVRLVPNSSSSHPWYAKVLAAQRAESTAQGPDPHTEDVSGSSDYSDLEEAHERKYLLHEQAKCLAPKVFRLTALIHPKFLAMILRKMPSKNQQ